MYPPPPLPSAKLWHESITVETFYTIEKNTETGHNNAELSRNQRKEGGKKKGEKGKEKKELKRKFTIKKKVQVNYLWRKYRENQEENETREPKRI